MENEEMRELKPEDLEKIDGGLVVYRGLLKDCWVVDDTTGEKLDSIFLKFDAQTEAIRRGLSEKVISEKEYKKMFNK